MVWRVFGWKSVHRVCITSAQKSQHSGSASCWRNCGSQEANHYHLFWACPKVNDFWRKIYSELVTIFGTKNKFKWDKLLFGLLRSTSTNIKIKLLFGILSVAARKAITRKWLQPNAPSMESWYDIIYEIFVMERITFSLRLQQHKFEEVWVKCNMYIAPKRPSFV